MSTAHKVFLHSLQINNGGRIAGTDNVWVDAEKSTAATKLNDVIRIRQASDVYTRWAMKNVPLCFRLWLWSLLSNLYDFCNCGSRNEYSAVYLLDETFTTVIPSGFFSTPALFGSDFSRRFSMLHFMSYFRWVITDGEQIEICQSHFMLYSTDYIQFLLAKPTSKTNL